MFTIRELYYYPLKSAKGIATKSLQLDARGPLFDRQWMVVSDTGKFVTQRQCPKMCLIETQVQTGRLSLAAPGMPDIDTETTERTCEVTVWNDTVTALDCGDDAAHWLSGFLKRKCRLVEMPATCERLVDARYASDKETVSFADGFPLLITSMASLEEFNTALSDPIEMLRFRPNIVVDGCAAFAEDDWQELSLGSIKVSLVKPCSRCIIPSINPQSGDKQMAVNDALNKTRRRNGKTYFGQNALHHDTGILSVGDRVVVIN